MGYSLSPNNERQVAVGSSPLDFGSVGTSAVRRFQVPGSRFQVDVDRCSDLQIPPQDNSEVAVNEDGSLNETV